MTAVTAEQRRKQLNSNKAFELGKKNLDAHINQNEAKLSMTQQRLLKRLQNSTAQVPFFDGDEEFHVEVRLLSPSEQQLILQLQIKLGQFKRKMMKADKLQPEEIEKAVSEAQKLLEQLNWWVAEVCVDPELNQEYWSTGTGFNSDVPAHILAETVKASQKYAEDLSWFRKKQTR